jgi:hypothetical protein
VTNDLLRRLAADFASQIQRLLNATICNNIRINSVLVRPGTVVVAHKLERKLLESRPIPVGQHHGKPLCWLDLTYRLCWDEGEDYLTVQSSFLAIYAPDRQKSVLCHFDYERTKQDGYPESHLQVHGTSTALEAWKLSDKRGLDKLHFPTGGRRFRPTLEDVIDFLVAERLVPDLSENGRNELEAGRERFRVIQLRAAIRRDPDTARQALRDFGQ